MVKVKARKQNWQSRLPGFMFIATAALSSATNQKQTIWGNKLFGVRGTLHLNSPGFKVFIFLLKTTWIGVLVTKDSLPLPLSTFHSVLLIRKWSPIGVVPYGHKPPVHEASNVALMGENPHNIMIG